MTVLSAPDQRADEALGWYRDASIENLCYRPSEDAARPDIVEIGPPRGRRGVALGHRTRRCPDRRCRRRPAASSPGGWPRPGSRSSASSRASGSTGPTTAGNKLDWELKMRKDWATSPNIRGLPEDYPIVEDDTAGLAADVLRGRRLDAHLRRRLAADAAVRLPRPLARRHRRRLADRLRRAAAVLRADRPPVRRVRAAAATRPIRPTPRTRRCRRCRSASAGLKVARGPRPSSAGTGGPSSTRSTRSPYDGRRPCVQREHLPAGLQRGRQGLDRPDPLAEGDRARRAARHRRARPPHRDERRGLATGATWIDRDGGEHFEPARVVVLAANAIGTPRLLLLSASPARTRTGWRTRPASSGRG